MSSKSLIEWNENLKIGLAVVDRQHERLFGIINRLQEATIGGKGTDVISETIDELIIYTATHFRMEEKYFALFEYLDAEQHKREHDALMIKVSAYAIDFAKAPRSSRSALANELLQFLKMWWQYHMLETDSKFVTLFRERGLT